MTKDNFILIDYDEKINIFMSIPEENPNIQFLRNKLLSLGIKIIDNTSFNVDIDHKVVFDFFRSLK